MDLSIPDEKLRVHFLNRNLYKALMEGDDAKVVELCKQIPECPLHVLSIYKDTVLHMATYSERTELALNLLQMLCDSENDKLTMENDVGSTVLQDAATSNETIPVAKEMLRKAPKLLGMRNKSGDTALFRAARYGQTKMFKFLDIEVDSVFAGEGQEEERKAFYQKNDKTTILHATILTGHFDLALYMARKHRHLLSIKDGDGLTVLQLLACNPSVFDSGSKQSYLKRLIHSCKFKPVIKNAMVELDGAPFKKFASMKEEWALNNNYISPAIQFIGPVADKVNHTLLLEHGVHA